MCGNLVAFLFFIYKCMTISNREKTFTFVAPSNPKIVNMCFISLWHIQDVSSFLQTQIFHYVQY